MKIRNLVPVVFLVLALFSFTDKEETSTIDEFEFDGHITYDMTYIDKKGREQSFPYTIYFNEGKELFGIKMIMNDKNTSGETIIIYDKSDKKMHMLMDNEGEKTAMAMPFNPQQLENAAENMEPEDFTFEKTGNTKEILGYTCHEYKFESDDASGTSWITEEADVSSSQIAGLLGMGNKGKNKNPLMGAYPEGIMMESEGETKKGEKYKMVVTELNTDNPVTISTEGYKSMMSFGK
ncbi:DUF4412 domain-containing protein [Mangrovivirga sp. M17]|uniref:DUF4412 domain-containing protein n=1 Tax=Mangrovivirga halotolerans TaxID=2993936 RepID=A0ABT3RT62_9BACT|nr:DUF4412 domain-containing protein [Mangrovivirga halotolerans]MCX2744768.1 DUF4412 domain-containing protein [Mangrovivirga halotolerans]